MTEIRTPIYLVHLNYDYDEKTQVTTDRVSAILKLFAALGVAIDPRKGIDEDTWRRATEHYDAANWKGASIFRIDGIDPEVEVAPLWDEKVSPEELARARITGLTGNEDRQVYVILGNLDFEESAIVCPDLESVTEKLIDNMEITRHDVEDADGRFEGAINSAYNTSSWKGLSVVELDLKTAKIRVVDPSELPFEIDRHLPVEDENDPDDLDY